MKDIEKIKITKNTKIKQALKIISDGNLKIAVVVDKKGKLLGTLTDGDIRRGFLKGLNLNSSIETIIYKKPTIAKKNDNKNKILKMALSERKYQIPVVDRNNKIIGIHVLDELIKKKDKSNLVVIMAGGRGVRLRPLTKNIPKPMLNVGNKPILQNILEKFRDNGYKKFVICVKYKSKIISNYFGNGKKFGIKIEYIEEQTRMGTAGALSLLKKKPREPFFIINGDVLTNLNFEKMLDFHNDQKAKATMCVTEYNFSSPYGEVVLKNENILTIHEKPIHKIFVNTGIYILDPKCLNLVPRKYYDIPSLFKKIILNKYKTISFPLGEYWMDIGKIADFERANREYYHIFKS
jgi:dTDP-glucose pyrophosphorylase